MAFVLKLLLDGKWKFKDFSDSIGKQAGAHNPDFDDHDWANGQVPGTVHTDLLSNRLIEDPFWGTNEAKTQWINEKEWWYRREFNLPEELAGREALELVFEGLDTFAWVWVNGVLVGESDNMFIPWRSSVKGVVKAGRNVLAVQFKPIYGVAAELERRFGGVCGCLHAENCANRPYVRKAAYMFGWDWAPTLPTEGIWRSVHLEGFDVARLGYLAALPVEVSAQSAIVKMSVEVYALKECSLDVKFAVEGFGQKQQKTVTQTVRAGHSLIETNIKISNPHLWWPIGYGTPDRYDVTVKLYAHGKLLDSAERKCGIRKVELLQQPDKEGTSFAFEVNGRRVFCRGANWVPADFFLPRVTADRYRGLLELAAEANMNMLRVWGGGVYEDEAFYGLCDELGVMVWQDFMYACAAYPQEEWFLKAAEREAEAAVLRLRAHPCIVVWCGNNEIQWHHREFWRDRENVSGLPIFNEILPRVLRRLDGTRPYRPSSPYGGEDPNNEAEGTRHNWEVWSKGVDYLGYLKDRGRFLTEFGWQAPPTPKRMRKYLDGADLNVDSQAFLAHEKQTGGIDLMKKLLAFHYPVPTEFARFVLYAQLNQADALKTAVTHWRGRMPQTSGCLVWQLNDCWPAVSWSLIDYGANPKPAYYTVKRAFEPVIAPLIVKDGTARVFVINESANDLEATLRLQLMTFGGKVLFNQESPVSVAPYSSQFAMEKTLSSLPMGDDRVFAVTLQREGKVIFEDATTASDPKNLELPYVQPRVETEKAAPAEFTVKLTSAVFAKAVWLSLKEGEGRFRDNFFDLLPQKEKAIRCSLKNDFTQTEFDNSLSVDTYPYSTLNSKL